MTTLTNLCEMPLTHALGWTLVHLCWQGTAIAALLWCVLEALGGMRSKARYAAACLALALMVVVPLATFVHLAAEEYRLRAAMNSLPIEIDPGMVIQVGAGNGATSLFARIGVALDHAMPGVLLAWFVGVLFFVGRLNYGLMVARRLQSAGLGAAATELQDVFERLRQRLGVTSAVQLMHSALVEVPTVVGWLRPFVLIPVGCLSGMSPSQIEAILAHELGHIRRHDYLVSVMQSMVESLLFYHPAVWWVSKQVRNERECCCDELAVSVCGDRLTYARALSQLEERRSLYPDVALGVDGGGLTMRIKRLLGCGGASTASQMAAAMVLTTLVIAAGGCIVTMARAESSTVQREARVALPMEVEASAPLNLQIAGQAERVLRLKGLVELAQVETPAAAAARPIGPVRVSNGVVAGMQLTKVNPVYPAEAMEKRVQGAVLLHAVISKTGTIESLEVISGPELLRAAATDAVRQWTYKPYLLNGEPTAVDTSITVNFSLGDENIAGTAPLGNGSTPTGPVHVSSGVMAGLAISKPDPICSGDVHESGTVILHVIISKEGTVESLSIVRVPEVLRSCVIDAVKQWKYKPYLLNGQPTEVETSITMNLEFGGTAQLRDHPSSSGTADENTQKPQPLAEQQHNDSGTEVKKIGGGVTPPKLIYMAEANYTPEAKAAKLEGIVMVQLIVDQKGLPVNVHVTKGVGIGLDEKAVEAVKKYKFKPAMELGKPVAVAMNIEVNFKLF